VGKPTLLSPLEKAKSFGRVLDEAKGSEHRRFGERGGQKRDQRI